MLDERKFRTSWIGKDSIFNAWMSYDNDNNYYVRKPNPKFPFLHKWILVFKNIQEIIKNDYEKRFVFDPDSGLTNQEVYVYPYDFKTLEPYYPRMNKDHKALMQNLRIERDFLHKQLVHVETMVKEGADKNTLQEIFKKDHDYYRNLKPSSLSKEQLEQLRGEKSKK